MTKITYSLERKPTIIKNLGANDRVIPRETRKLITQIDWLIGEGRFLEAADKAHEHGMLLGFEAWDHTRGIQFHLKALSAAKKAGNEFRETRANVWLAFHNTETSNYRDAIAYYTDFLSNVTKGNHFFDVAYAHAKIGQCCSDLGRTEEDVSLLEKAAAHLKKALVLFRDHPGAAKSEFGIPDDRADLIFEARLFLGVSLYFTGDVDRGFKHVDAAFAIAEKSGNLEHLKLVYAYRAFIAEHRQDYKECLVNARKVLAICEKRGDEYFEKARILNDMGVYYMKLGRYQKALDAFERHKQLCEAFDTDEAIDAAQERIQEVCGLLEIETDVQRLTLELRNSETRDPSAVCLLRKERGVRYMQLGRYADACADFQFVYSASLASTGGPSRARDVLALDLGKCYLKADKPADALSILRSLASSVYLSAIEVGRTDLLIAQALFAVGSDEARVENTLFQVLGKLQAIQKAESLDSQEQETSVDYQIEALQTLCSLYKKTKSFTKLAECKRDLASIEDSRVAKDSQGDRYGDASAETSDEDSSERDTDDSEDKENLTGESISDHRADNPNRKRRVDAPCDSVPPSKKAAADAVTINSESDSDVEVLPRRLSQLFPAEAPQRMREQSDSRDSLQSAGTTGPETPSSFKGSDKSRTPQLAVQQPAALSLEPLALTQFQRVAPFRVRVKIPLSDQEFDTFVVPCKISNSEPWTVDRVSKEAALKFESIYNRKPRIFKLTSDCGDTLCPFDIIWDVVDDKSLVIAIPSSI